MSQNIKKSYRDKLLASRGTSGREFELEDMKLFFKFPTRKDKRDIIALSTKDDWTTDPILLETWATIKLTQVAETKEQLFSNEDFEVIENLPLGSDFDKACGEAVMALLGADSDPKDLPKD